MALTDITKTDYTFKSFNFKARGTNSAQFFEENIPRNPYTSAEFVWTESIPYTPPTETSSVVKKWYPFEDGGDGWIVMTRDRSVDGGRKWVALDVHSSNWSSGSGDVTKVLRGFIGPKYGPQYIVKVFDGAGNQIPELDASDWVFDYDSGVLVFNSSDRSESGSTLTASIKIKVFQYIGKTLKNSSPSVASFAMKRGTVTGNIDGINSVFALPEDLNTDLYYVLKCNGLDMYPGADFTVNVNNLREITLHDTVEVYGDGTDRLDVIYYPVS